MLRRYSKQEIILVFILLATTIGLIAPPLITHGVAVNGGGASSGSSLYDKMLVKDKAASLMYYNAISKCMSKSTLVDDYWAHDNIIPSNALKGRWFNTSLPVADFSPAIGYFNGNIGDNSLVNCDALETITSAAAKMWGYSEKAPINYDANIKLLCDTGAQREDSSETSCVKGASQFTGFTRGNGWEKWNQLDVNKFQNAIKTNVYGGVDPNYLRELGTKEEKAAQYYQDRLVFFGGCLSNKNPSVMGEDDKDNDNRTYTISDIQPDGKFASNRYYAGANPDGTSGKTKDTGIDYFVDGKGTTHRITCGDLAARIDQNAGSYAEIIAALTPEQQEKQGEKPGGITESGATKCAVEGIGWILCPVINAAADIADGAFKMLANNFLSTNVDMLKVNEGAYNAWSNMRNVANIVFVIFFMIIIFSQLTGFGIDNYGIKKLLPKIVIAAILVNISFFICQIAVDLSNIVGYGLKEFLGDFAPTSSSGWSTGLGGKSFAGLSAGVLTGVALVGAVGWTLWSSIAALVPILLTAVVALVMIMFILIARQALVILLIVISPLAFVAYLLPNTEQWFKKWLDAFKAVLLVFPIVGLIYGASSLASAILFKVANGNQMLEIIYSAVMVLPLFIVPGLLKKSLDGIGSIGGKLNEWGAKRGASLGSKGADVFGNTAFARGRETRKLAKADFRNQKYADSLGKNGIRSRLSRGLGWSKAGRYANESLNRQASAITSAAEDKEVAAHEAMMKSQNAPGLDLIKAAETTLRESIINGDTVKARAAQKILLGSGGKGLSAAKRAISTSEAIGKANGNDKTLRSLRTDMGAAGLKGKHAVLAKWGVSTDSIGAIEGDSGTFSGLTASELAGQEMESLEAPGAAGITKEQAEAILDNNNISGNLEPDQLNHFNGIAGR